MVADPAPELADLPNVAQSCRAYEPFELSHYPRAVDAVRRAMARFRRGRCGGISSGGVGRARGSKPSMLRGRL